MKQVCSFLDNTQSKYFVLHMKIKYSSTHYISLYYFGILQEDKFEEDPKLTKLIVFEEMIDVKNQDIFQLNFYNNLGWRISLLLLQRHYTKAVEIYFFMEIIRNFLFIYKFFQYHPF